MALWDPQIWGYEMRRCLDVTIFWYLFYSLLFELLSWHWIFLRIQAQKCVLCQCALYLLNLFLLYVFFPLVQMRVFERTSTKERKVSENTMLNIYFPSGCIHKRKQESLEMVIGLETMRRFPIVLQLKHELMCIVFRFQYTEKQMTTRKNYKMLMSRF